MPISLISGLPGAGKTLRMMEVMDAAVKRAERPIWAHGIAGLAPGLASNLEDPREWNAIIPGRVGDCTCPDGVAQALRAEGVREFLLLGREKIPNPEWLEQLAAGRPHAHVVPDGSLIFVDEAWQQFGRRDDAANSPVPAYAQALAIHRHRGLDFVFTTQLPIQLYPFVRALIGDHTHIVRSGWFGRTSTMYEWGELVEDVKSSKQRANALATRWAFPKRLFGLYKSASLHTIKPSLPKRMWLLPVGAVVVAALWYYGLRSTAEQGKASSVPLSEQDAASGSPADASASRGGKKAPKPKTAEEWAVFLTPVLPGIPFTAPAFAERPIVAAPRNVCMIAGDDFRDPGATVCRCKTEQGTTPPGISNALCRSLAMNGYYDPTLAPPLPPQSAAFSGGGFQSSTPAPSVSTLPGPDRSIGGRYEPPGAGVGAQPLR